ncbi:cilia- and flagella-associated protein 52 [Apus apus]|uniref:cilia- and flagella-associated protein 52 n=1 Tax=Apus apus TaxID=8895 RepID=UPI0021F897EE|nr:cilia- and flagella-associated protein 52 [Apus apus]
MAAGPGELELRAAIGFNGHVPSGLICHPNDKDILYPLGCAVVIQDLDTKTQYFLRGHTNNVSCLALSRKGEYVASGQYTAMGFQADIILWEFHTKQLLARLARHKGKVERLAFSVTSLYLVSLGGQDDGSVVVWDIGKREAVCGSPASPRSAGSATLLVCSSSRDEMFVTSGNFTVRIWELDVTNRKIWPSDCQTGSLKRVAACIKMADDDNYFYFGTTSGDILKINTNNKLMVGCGPQKKLFGLGVTALTLLKTGDFIVGTGEGIVALCTGSNYRVMKKIEVHGAVTSLTCRGQGYQFFVGTSECQIYQVTYTEFKEELFVVCHSEAVHDIVFPFGTPDLFVTCSRNDIRVWLTPENKELVRIVNRNMTCNAVEVMRDGESIISGWSDGTIRAFTPQTGRVMYVIINAHSREVSALATTSDCKQIVSGGGEGQVRVWEISEKTQKLVEVMKQHTAGVSCIKITKNDKECVTASLDGSCIIWDLVHFVRKQMILAKTLFKCVCYYPEEYQILTGGTDRKIGFWEVIDGSEVRSVEGSASGSINGMDITSSGTHFVTGGDDHLVKLWSYNEGEVTHVGVGHSGNISRLKISPENKYIVSVSADGAILIWKYPDLQ